MAIAIKNLDAALGAEIADIDLSKPLPRADVDAIEAAWHERLVVVFHGQILTDPQLIAFSRNFGELDPPGPNPYGQPFNKEHPELNVISNVVENGKPIGNLGDGEAVWHADMTYVEVPPKAAILHALEVPPPEAGGSTYFANMFAAYESLPADLKKSRRRQNRGARRFAQQRGYVAQGLQGSHRCSRDGGGATSGGSHRSEDRSQGAFPRSPSERLRAWSQRG